MTRIDAANEAGGREVILMSHEYGADPVPHIDAQLFLQQRQLIQEFVNLETNNDKRELLEGIESLLDCIADYGHDHHGMYGLLFEANEPCCYDDEHVNKWQAEHGDTDQD